MAGSMKRTLRPLDGLAQRTLEADEATACAAVRRKLEQLLLGRFDLRDAVEFGFGAEGVVDDRLADIDQLPPHPGIVDRPAVFARVDDAHHRAEKLGQIRDAPHLLQHARVFEFGFQRHRIG